MAGDRNAGDGDARVDGRRRRGVEAPGPNSKLLAGSLLTGFGLLATVANGWARHFFFTQYHIARATSLEATGTFDPGTYLAGPEAVELFLGARILVWGVVLLGLLLVVWGVWEQHRDRRGRG